MRYELALTSLGYGFFEIDPDQKTGTMHPFLGEHSGGRPSPDMAYNTSRLQIITDPDGHSLWMSGWSGGLRRWDAVSKKWEQFTPVLGKSSATRGFAVERIARMHRKSAHEIWLALPSGGLALFDSQSRKFHLFSAKNDPANSISINYATTLFTDRDGRLWFSGPGAPLKCLDPFAAFFRNTGLSFSGGKIVAACPDPAHGKTWFLQKGGDGRPGSVVELDEKSGRTRQSFFPELGEAEPGRMWRLRSMKRAIAEHPHLLYHTD